MTHTDKYTVTEYEGGDMLLENFMYIGEDYCEADLYDVYDVTINDNVDMMVKVACNGIRGYCRIVDRIDEEMFGEEKKTYLMTRIKSKYKRRVILKICCSKGGKFWLNGEILSIHNYSQPYTNYVSAVLNEGINDILLEQYVIDSDYVMNIEILNGNYDLAAVENDKFCNSRLTVSNIHEDGYFLNMNDNEFMFLSNNKGYIKDSFEVEVNYNYCVAVDTFEAKLGEKFTVMNRPLSYICRSLFKPNLIKLTFFTTDGKRIPLSVYL